MYDYYDFGSKAVREEIEQIKDKEKEHRRDLCRKRVMCLKLRKPIRILINKASNEEAFFILFDIYIKNK